MRGRLHWAQSEERREREKGKNVDNVVYLVLRSGPETQTCFFFAHLLLLLSLTCFFWTPWPLRLRL
jgi:hypothetical protein